MYLHAGHDVMIREQKIVAIVDVWVLETSAATRQFFDRLRAMGKVEGDLRQAKSMVILEDGIYVSKISASTLARRGQISVLGGLIARTSE